MLKFFSVFTVAYLGMEILIIMKLTCQDLLRLKFSPALGILQIILIAVTLDCFTFVFKLKIGNVCESMHMCECVCAIKLWCKYILSEFWYSDSIPLVKEPFS